MGIVLLCSAQSKPSNQVQFCNKKDHKKTPFTVLPAMVRPRATSLQTLLPWTVSSLSLSFGEELLSGCNTLQLSSLIIPINHAPLHSKFPATDFIQNQQNQMQHLPFQVDQTWYRCPPLSWDVPDGGGTPIFRLRFKAESIKPMKKSHSQMW